MTEKYNNIPLLPEKDIKRFWSKVNILGADDCWLWTAGLRNKYGQFSYKHVPYKSNRIAYFLHYDIDPKSFIVCHTCDNPICCNPAHLWLGTQQDNQADKATKGRQAKGDTHYSRTKPEKLARGERNGMQTHPESHVRGENHPLVINPELAARGESNGNSKLTAENVKEIRLRYSQGNVSQCVLAKEFGVEQTVISAITRRKIWKHLA